MKKYLAIITFTMAFAIAGSLSASTCPGKDHRSEICPGKENRTLTCPGKENFSGSICPGKENLSGSLLCPGGKE